MKEYKATRRETMGYQIYAQGRIYPYKKVESKVTCKNGGYSMTFENNYSDKEKTILKDKNLCLNIETQKEDDINFDVKECKDYQVLDSSKSDGIECGYFVVNINLKSGKKAEYKTCSLFNLKLIKKIADLDMNQIISKQKVEEIIEEMGIEDELDSFNAEAYNGKGKKIIYDSKSKEIIVEGSGYMLMISKYLLLLLLILTSKV